MMSMIKILLAGGLGITAAILIFKKIERNKRMNNLFNRENKQPNDGVVKVNNEQLNRVMQARAKEMDVPEIPELKLNKPTKSDELWNGGDDEPEYITTVSSISNGAITTIRNGGNDDLNIPAETITAARKKELRDRIQGMSLEELELVADILPIQLCLKRIDRELARAKEFEDSVKKALGSLA